MIESIIASPEVVHYICKRFDIKMSKKLGQNVASLMKLLRLLIYMMVNQY